MANANLPTRWRNVIISHPGLTLPSEILVGMILYKHMDNVTGKCYPSILKIAEECRLTEKTVRTALNKLESLRLIVRHREKYKNASFSHYVYFPGMPLEIVTATNEKLMEIKDPVSEINNQNQRKSLPPNYPYNYPINYMENINKQEKLEQHDLDPNESKISISDYGRTLLIGESQVRTKKDFIKTISKIQNRFEQDKVTEWVLNNGFSEIKDRKELNSYLKQ